ncbi:hydantoinase/oxoprolinase family protein [Methylobrevis albus]|uniref:Hydantoinase/oxoprolinase family protein n=1 Tax=Methylobrevis albus TaxID=2793297 RepID=A0A931I5A7_9HYPH|nr:hydantoinase/oxoprolinase family protein [Methylobrevis albus]MBH0239098.1 hydantoinase/oxoprolinase family protein [Methylobrevis albus]
MRLSIDVGGTFTDLVMDRGGVLSMYKAATTYPDPVDGILDAVAVAAEQTGGTVAGLLAETDLLFHSTTRAINAVVTGRTARTALLVSAGHPDILVIREGGRTDPFNYQIPYPPPYIPRSLTFEVPGRIWADGREMAPFEEATVLEIITAMRAAGVEAVAVSLIWSIVNPAHELAVGRLIEAHLPGVPYTLSHQLNPTVREYRRTSSAAIDASLKPIMQGYMHALKTRLGEAGLKGRIFAVTSQGGLVDVDDLSERPILALNSGPSMAPVAGRYFSAEEGWDAAIVTDAGGTTYDVSLVKDGVIPWTRDTWLGTIYRGHLTGFPSVDVKSIGAGGGSIARVDASGLLHVGPESAGSTPGPVCYGRGGTRPTVTDAAVVLGYIDPGFFLGGRMGLARDAAREVVERDVALPLGLSVEDAALAIIDLATEQMVNAIEDITVKQGIDPTGTAIIGGGGAAGINTVLIARRLRCSTVIVPDVCAALSAAGAMMSELTRDFAVTAIMPTRLFDPARAQAIVADLTAKAEAFFAAAGADAFDKRIDLAIEGRYPSQVWEIEVPFTPADLGAPDAVARLVAAFHARHQDLFSFRDDGDDVEIMGWRAVARCRVAEESRAHLAPQPGGGPKAVHRTMTFRETGPVEAPAFRWDDLDPAEPVVGPAVIESSFTSVVINPGATARKKPSGQLVISL